MIDLNLCYIIGLLTGLIAGMFISSIFYVRAICKEQDKFDNFIKELGFVRAND